MKLSPSSQFILRFSLYIIGIACIAAFPVYKYLDPALILGLVYSLGLFYVLTIVSYLMVQRNVNKDGLGYLNAFLFGMVVKMFVSLIFFLIVYKQFKNKEIEFAVCFFVSYAVCTFFEVYYLMAKLRQI